MADTGRAAGQTGLMGFLKRNIEYTIYAYVLIVVVSLGVFVDRLIYDHYIANERETVQEQMNALTAKIVGDLSNKTILLRGMVALVSDNPQMSEQRYSEVASRLTEDYPEILNVAAAPNLVVRYVYPENKNRSVLGFDYRSSPEQLPDVLRARDTRKTIISGPVHLLQGGSGFIVRAPVFHTDGKTGAQTFWGVVSAVIDAKDFFRTTGLSDPNLPISVSLSHSTHASTRGVQIFGDPEVLRQKPVRTRIDLPAGSWELAAIPKGGWPTEVYGAWIFRTVFVLGLVLLLAAVRYFNLQLRRRRLAERRLQDAISALDDGFVLYDANDRLVTCNRKYREIYSATPDLFEPGTPFEKIIRAGVRNGQFAPSDDAPEQWVRKRLRAHRQALSETQQQLNDGRWLKVTDRRTPDGHTVGLRVDVTELRNAMEAAQAASTAKSDFLNVLSHELRTPLTVILGNARVLCRKDDLPQIRALRDAMASEDAHAATVEKTEAALNFLTGLAQKIESSSEHLLRLITEMLDFSKIEAGKMELEIETLELVPLVEGVLDGFRANAAAKGIALEFDSEALRVSADRTRLAQILINVVGNAIKFTDEGEIRVAARAQDGMVEISVSDTGCGIAAEHLDAVFDSFRQVDASSTRRAGGTGLGLTITKRLIELHGGHIRVSSELDQGSIFRIEIPEAPRAAEADSPSVMAGQEKLDA